MIEVKLRYPIEFEGRKIDKLTFRRLKTGEIARGTHKGDEFKTAMNIAAISAELPVSAIEEIDAADFREISEALEGAGFFEHTTPRT